MKKLLIAMVGAVLVLGACGAAEEPVEEEPTPQETPAEEEAPAAEETAAPPEELYSQSCASCHGGDLEGAVYPESIAGLSYEEVLEKLQEGHPASGGLDDEEAEIVAEWIAAQ